MFNLAIDSKLRGCDVVALAVTAALQGPELAALREKHFRAHHRATETMTVVYLPYIPSREEFSAEANAMFARLPSLDENVDRAYELVLASVGMRLTVPAEGHSSIGVIGIPLNSG